jgi:hypothetical protein
MEYEALSYYWGNELPTKEIKITRDQSSQEKSSEEVARSDSDELKFYIRDNLFAALQVLREPDKDLDLWVDALCINQEDGEEKKKQIAKMEDIYSMASNVIIWLGKLKDAEAATAINFVEDLCNLRRFDMLLSDEYAHGWEALAELMTNSWFSRRVCSSLASHMSPESSGYPSLSFCSTHSSDILSGPRLTLDLNSGSFRS